MNAIIKVSLSALILAGMFQYGYVTYVYPTFDYAGYGYREFGLLSNIFTYLLIVLPLALYRESRAPSLGGVGIVYALCYLPAQLVLQFTWQHEISSLAAVQTILAASMSALFVCGVLGRKKSAVVRNVHGMLWVIMPLTLASVLILVSAYHQNMRIVGFSEVYDLRFSSNEVETTKISQYLLLWLSYCFIPFLFALAYIRHQVLYFVVGTVCCILVYAATGAKIVVLMPVIVFGLNFLYRWGSGFLFRLHLALIFLVASVVLFLPDEGLYVWMKSILLVRVLGTGGWTLATYYEYFSNNEYTFYTHIGPINFITKAYPYGEYSLGQVIGIEYSGSADANFNANFWASDGFAAMGVWGLPVVTVVVCVVLVLINRLSSGYPNRFCFVWLSGFWMALLNVPLSTAMLSCGGLLVMLLLWMGRQRGASVSFDGVSYRTEGPVTLHQGSGL